MSCFVCFSFGISCMESKLFNPSNLKTEKGLFTEHKARQTRSEQTVVLLCISKQR